MHNLGNLLAFLLFFPYILQMPTLCPDLSKQWKRGRSIILPYLDVEYKIGKEGEENSVCPVTDVDILLRSLEIHK